jgi:hypothetical protein
VAPSPNRLLVAPMSLSTFLLLTLFACFLTFDHRFFAALTIAARPAADETRFLTTLISLPVESPNAFAAARTPFPYVPSPICSSQLKKEMLVGAGGDRTKSGIEDV